ncbi:GL24496 [Drosophila persimilis]|uniref:GL24496 n=1 Tax=Drosophila persimilis TaxID=7234 RepID=B4G3Y2_DROPE|nr:GL24496 [Drosophila persimilis]
MPGERETSTADTTNDHIDLSIYRRLVKQFIEMRRYATALFWAEKVAVLSGQEPRDVYYQAQCMYLLGEFHRAAHTIRHHKLEKTSLPCFNLLLESLYAAKDYNEADAMIQTVEVDIMTTSVNQPVDPGSGCYIESNSVFGGEENSRNELLASIYLVKGKVYEALDNRGTAMDFYVQALHKSIYCFEALEALVQHEMLMAWEAHKLVDRYPDKAISWYAVGCYYDMIGKSDPARRYLSKATALDRLYGPAWLAYGHSFANENEHEQAMAAYFKATQLMRGCHLPLLYIGVECGLTKNLELAEKFFMQAMNIAPLDVYVLHELGLIKYEYEYGGAATIFQCTVDIVKQRAKAKNEEISARWEPLFINLGHSLRKIHKYEDALYNFQYALLLKPQSATTYTSIGFIHALLGDLDSAIESFHKSLSINRDCIVTSTILKSCIEDLMDDATTIDEICSAALRDVAKNITANSRRVLNSDKFNGMKLKFDEEEEFANSNSDSNMVVEMSFDT